MKRILLMINYKKWVILIYLLNLWIMPTIALDNENTIVRGLLVADIETTLSSQLNALIEKIKVKEGDYFKRNQLLVKFDCRLYQAELDKSKAQLQAAQKTLNANLQLQKFEAISDLEVILSESEFIIAKADVKLYKVRTTLCSIKAPFSGRVVKLHVAPYRSVSQGEPLIDILNDSKLEIRLNVPSKWLPAIKIGTRFKVKIDETGRTYKAKIIRIGAKIDPVSRTLPIMAAILGKDKHLLAGMSGVASFNLK